MRGFLEDIGEEWVRDSLTHSVIVMAIRHRFIRFCAAADSSTFVESSLQSFVKVLQFALFVIRLPLWYERFRLKRKIKKSTSDRIIYLFNIFFQKFVRLSCKGRLSCLIYSLNVHYQTDTKKKVDNYFLSF